VGRDQQPPSPGAPVSLATRAAGLALAAHLGPTLAVSVAVAGLAAAAGAPAAAVGALAGCVLLGQLSVGWCNDAVDAAADIAAGRTAKPVARHWVTAAELRRLAWVALAAAVIASFVWLPGPAAVGHTVALIMAWAYNLRVKDTVWSPVPYAVAFGLVPSVVGAVARPDTTVPWWLTGAAAVLGVAAHLANTAGDVVSDLGVGRGGLAARLGDAGARIGVVVLLAVAAVLLTLGLDLGPTGLVVLLAQLVALGALAVWRHGRLLFPGLLLMAAGYAVVLALGRPGG